MNLREARTLLADRGLVTPPLDFASTRRFGDGAQYRVEIPSCEGPAVMRTVLDEASARGGHGASGLAGQRRDDADRR